MATFDEDIFAITVDETSFTLANPAAGNITGSVSFDSSNNVATFTPDNALAPLAPYTATLSTSITDLSGNALATAFIWSFTIEDGDWGSAALIENNDVGSGLYPQIAFDNNGNALAVWYQHDGTRYNIWANRFDGSSWGSPELIETDNDGDAFNPQITFNNNGNAFAVWYQHDGARNNIWANRFDGTSWGSAELVESNVGNAANAQIAIDNNGNALAVWQEFNGTRSNIWVNHFDGSNWGSPELIETNSAGSAIRVQIAIDSNGNALAVWEQSDGTRFNIRANRFDGSNWGNAELIETDNFGDAMRPQIAIDNNGNALAVWRQSDGTRFNIWANRFDGSNWGSAELIETDNGGNADSPQIAIDNNGNALAVWFQTDGARNNIWANRFDGTSWSSAELIETNNAGGALRPQIVIDNNGSALAVWYEYDGIRFNVWANRFDGSNWGSAELIETDNTGNALRPQIAIDNNGNALAVWYQHNGTRFNIWANRFE